MSRATPESVVLAIDPVCRELDPDQVRAASERGFRLWAESPPFDVPMVPRDAQRVIGVACTFGARPLWDYHAQLQILREASGGAAHVLDASAQTLRSCKWLDEVVASTVPPSPASLYTVHSVFEARHRPIWLHTHGLERCGIIELDAVDVPASFVKGAARLLHVTSLMFIDEGIPEAGEPFEIGRGMDLLWLPWEEGISKMRRRSLGGRKDRDAHHTGARGILFAGRKYQSLAVYRDMMEDDPLLYVPEMEIERAQLLAKQRLPRFRALFERFAGSHGWKFLVQLKYPTDCADDGTEYLWFEVHDIVGDQMDATLRNYPYYVSTMYDGQRGRHSLERLSDWSIMCPSGSFDPDNVGELEAQLTARVNPSELARSMQVRRG